MHTEARNPARPAAADPAAGSARRGIGSRVRVYLNRGLGMSAAIMAFSLLLIGAIWSAAAFQAQRERQNAVEIAVKQNSNLAIAFEEQTVRTLKGVDAATLFIAREYERFGVRVDLAAYIRDDLIDRTLFTNVVVVDEHGDLVLSSRALVPLNVADRDYFKAHAQQRTGKLFVGKAIVSRTYGKLVIPMSRRIDKPDGSFGGIVSALVDVHYFIEFYERTNLGERGVVYLVGLDGIARARRAGMTTSVGDDMSRSTLMGYAGRASLGEFLSLGRIEGVPRYQSFRTLSDYPLIVVVGTSQAEVLAESDKNRRRYYGAAGLFSTIVIVFSALLIVALRRNERALRALSASETQFRATFEQAAIGLAHTDPSERFLRVNDKLCRVLGYTRDELLNMTIHDLTPAEDAGLGAINRQRLVAGEIETVSVERRCVRKDGTVIWVNRTISMVRNAAGEPEYFIRVMEDITERKRLQHALQHLADHDRLTGLPNRGLVQDRLEHAIDQARRRKRTVGVLFIDLDRFKVVNDTLGHSMGDRLLRLVAERLTACVRAEDTVGRLGGDEFAVILTELTRVEDAGMVAQKVLTALAASFDLEGHEAFVNGSVGIATYPHDGDSADVLIRNSDAAMYRAKTQGKNNVQVYAAAMNEQLTSRLKMENDLRHAIEREEFVLHYQPKAALGSGVITGVEALLRWQTPTGDLVPPLQFIALLEETGLIVPVGEWVLRTACAQIRAWLDAGLVPIPISVNLSARQFHQQDVTGIVGRALLDHSVPPHLLELEITETAAMHNAEAAATALEKLKALGVRIAIDDFGTGYSSLGYLKRFPLDSLKIDRSFIADVPDDRNDSSIAQAVITMSHALGLSVVAEGVENERQMAFLVAHGCDEIQGYHLSRPMPATECTAFLRTRCGPGVSAADQQKACA